MNSKQRKSEKKKVGRREKRVIESMPDTPENVAKALFGIKSDNPKDRILEKRIQEKSEKKEIAYVIRFQLLFSIYFQYG